ncbi:MAG: hypothetical protein PHR71_06995 [Polaromonas sp.]|nr:hypothetical protein [Polaromonas sp.]
MATYFVALIVLCGGTLLVRGFNRRAAVLALVLAVVVMLACTPAGRPGKHGG